MNVGVFRDGHPRLTLTLPGHTGAVEIEFLVDTGFDGDLALPMTLLRLIEARQDTFLRRRMADGTIVACPVFDLEMDWEDETRVLKVLVLGGEPLLGTRFLQDQHFHAEMTEGGEIVVEPL